MEAQQLIKILKDSDCGDPFECIFGMYGKNKKGHYGCFALYPDGDPNEPNQGCIAHQAAKLIEKLMADKGKGRTEGKEGDTK